MTWVHTCCLASLGTIAHTHAATSLVRLQIARLVIGSTNWVLTMLYRAVVRAYNTPRVKRLLWRTSYDFLSRRYRDDRWTFMNYGYRPPHEGSPLALAPEDEPDRSC